MSPAVRSLVTIESGVLEGYWNGYGRGLLVIEAGGEVASRRASGSGSTVTRGRSS